MDRCRFREPTKVFSLLNLRSSFMRSYFCTNHHERLQRLNIGVALKGIHSTEKSPPTKLPLITRRYAYKIRICLYLTARGIRNFIKTLPLWDNFCLIETRGGVGGPSPPTINATIYEILFHLRTRTPVIWLLIKWVYFVAICIIISFSLSPTEFDKSPRRNLLKRN